MCRKGVICVFGERGRASTQLISRLFGKMYEAANVEVLLHREFIRDAAVSS